jgi:hypothetical protein
MRLLTTLAAVLLVTTVAATPAHAAGDHPFGLGLELGAPTGLAAKYYLGPSSRGHMMAIQGGLGVIERYGDDGFHLHVEVLWHPAVLTRTPDFTLPFYVGVGGRLLENDDYYCVNQGNNRVCYDYYDEGMYLGVRAPFGLLMDFHKVSLDVFLELALVVDFLQVGDDDRDYDHDLVHLNGALGVRYYF